MEYTHLGRSGLSVSRLQTDYIDIYQMHHVDRSTPFARRRNRHS